MHRRASSQSVDERPLAICIPRRKHSLRMHFLATQARQHCSPAPIHSLKRGPIRRVSQQRCDDESQRGIERREVSRREALLVELRANDARDVAEAIDAEDERALARLGRVVAQPDHGEWSGDVAAEQEDAETGILDAIAGGCHDDDEADKGD